MEHDILVERLLASDEVAVGAGAEPLNRCRSCGTCWESNAVTCPECGSTDVEAGHVQSPLEDRYRAEVARCLDAYTAALVKELRRICRKSLEDETYLIDFEVQSHGFPGYEDRDFVFQLRWDAMDEEVGQLDEGGKLLKGAGVTIPRELYWAAEYETLDRNAAAFRELATWFARCWEQAEGRACRYPAYLSHHDSSVSLDLKARRWVRNSTKWPDGA